MKHVLFQYLQTYFVNTSKTWLIAKQGDHANTISSFAGTGVSITPESRPYLGTAIRSQEYMWKAIWSWKWMNGCHVWISLLENSQDITECCLCCPHSWTNEQVYLLELHHPQHFSKNETTGWYCAPNSSLHWQERLHQVTSVCSPSKAGRPNNWHAIQEQTGNCSPPYKSP